MANNTRQVLTNKPLTFKIDIDDQDNRLDCAWFNPIVNDEIESLRSKDRSDRKLVNLQPYCANVHGGKRLPKGIVIEEDEFNKIPYIRSTDIKNLRVNLSDAVKISGEIHRLIQNYQLRKSDIALTIVGTIGEVGLLEDEVEVCDFTENIARIRINEDSILPRFLLYFLDSELGKIQSERFSVGSLQYKLSLQSCRNINIYLPFSNGKYDIEKQKYIVDTVDTIIEKAENYKQKSKRLIEESRNIVAKNIGLPIPSNDLKQYSMFLTDLNSNEYSRLDALFNNPYRKELLNIFKSYPTKPLGELIKPQVGNKILPSDFYKLVELEQIDEETGRIINYQEVPELGSEKILLKKGNLLISKLQPEKGKVVIVPDSYDTSVGSSELLPYSLTSNEVSIKYLWAVLRSNYILKQWEYELTGSSRMRIGPNEIKGTIIPIPERGIQEQIVTEIEEKINESDKLLENAGQLYTSAKRKFVELLLNN